MSTAADNSLETSEERSKKSVFIRTFGCQMNEYDSLKLEKILENEYSRVDTPENADLVLINTCSVREKPENKVYSLLGELRELKRDRPDLMVGVGGCVAQQEGSALVRRSKDIDFVFGTHNLSLVPALLEQRIASGQPQVAVDYRDEWEEMPLGFAGQNRVAAFVSISRGCNKNCTYCVVPTTRGAEVSRSEDEILKEIRLAVHRGAREVLLLGQTVNSYGLDLSPRKSFAALVKNIAAIEGLQRIRFTSPHPQEVRQDFIELMADCPKICRHIHMPLQSGSNPILKAMNRNYRRERYLKIIEDLKSRIPDIAITTDIIVGFPGESMADFEATLDVMQIVRFDSSFSFVFSPRPNTVAATMQDSVPAEEKADRLQRLQSLQTELTNEKLAKYLNTEVEVLLEGPTQHDPNKLQGRISQNVVLHLEDEDPKVAVGALVRARVVATNRHTLNGTLIS